MASSNENDDIPMLPVSDTSLSSRTRPFTARSRSVSLANPSSTIDVFENSTVVLGYTDPLGTQRRPPLVQMVGEPPFPIPPPSTGGSSDSVGASSSQPEKHDEHLLISGKLGMSNDPYSTSFPPDYNLKAAQIPAPTVSATSDSTLRNDLHDDGKGSATRFATYADKHPGIISPHSPKFQKWNTFFAFTCLLSIFVDPLFFFPIEVDETDMCIKINWTMAKILVVLRTSTDVLFLFNILLQFRLAYTDPQSTVVGSGQLVYDSRKIARRYCRDKFGLDLLILMPVPQILIIYVIPKLLGAYGANDAKNFLRAAVIFQCAPKIYRLCPLIAGQRPTGFIFESPWANFFINLFTFMLAGHVVGSCWYLFGLQRVNQCLRDACGINGIACKQLIDCGGSNAKILDAWKVDVSARACFKEEGFDYGIYWKAVNLTHDAGLLKRYSYSLFWGFQQISTLAGNQVPSYYIWEVLFTMSIIGLGLFLFALLIGNMQNFLLALGRRNMEMTLRRRDMEQWMSHRRFPEDVRKKVLEAERFNWNANRGVNEELLYANMPDDLQRDIRRHLFSFLKNTRIFSKMDESMLDVIRERLKHKTYLEGSMVLRRKDLIKNIVFIVRGKMVSTGEDGSRTPLLEGDVCGEELLTWYQEHSSVNPDGTLIRMASKRLPSKRDVCCVKTVEAFSLSVADLEHIVSSLPTPETPKQS